MGETVAQFTVKVLDAVYDQDNEFIIQKVVLEETQWLRFILWHRSDFCYGNPESVASHNDMHKLAEALKERGSAGMRYKWHITADSEGQLTEEQAKKLMPEVGKAMLGEIEDGIHQEQELIKERFKALSDRMGF